MNKITELQCIMCGQKGNIYASLLIDRKDHAQSKMLDVCEKLSCRIKVADEIFELENGR